MNKEAYKHIFNTYGRSPALWVCYLFNMSRTVLMRVVVVIFAAKMTSSASVGNFDEAKHYVVLFLVASLAAAVVGSIADLWGNWEENQVYGKEHARYYKKLTNKDMAFYRNNHTGYLTSMYRQYLDSSLLLYRLFRGNMSRTAISLSVPVVVLFFASPRIGLIAFIMVVSQVGYILWASSKANKHRLKSHEVYRKISGEVADDITNMVAYKSSGQEESAQKRMTKLRVEEMQAFRERRKTTVFLDFPRNIFTAILVSASFWLALSDTGSTQESINLLVLTITYMFQILRNVVELPELVYENDDLITKLTPTLSALSELDEDIKDKESPSSFSPENGEVEIKNLTFKYTDSKNSPYILRV